MQRVSHFLAIYNMFKNKRGVAIKTTKKQRSTNSIEVKCICIRNIIDISCREYLLYHRYYEQYFKITERQTFLSSIVRTYDGLPLSLHFG